MSYWIEVHLFGLYVKRVYVGKWLNEAIVIDKDMSQIRRQVLFS